MLDGEPTFQEAFKAYSREAAQATIEAAEEKRQELLQKFPLESWSTLPLDRYALGLGKPEESFCWWMEWGTKAAGSMKGGAASKHIIYRKRDGEWYFDHDLYPTQEAAWEAVRAGFVEAFGKAQAGDWDTIDQIESIRTGPALRTKTLYCYFPDSLLPISSIAHVRHFLLKLGKSSEADAPGYEVVRFNRALFAAIRSRSEFEGWTTQEVARFLYSWADPSERKRVVKIAPGEDAKYWDDCLQNGYICVGWEGVGDLRQFESKETFYAKFAEVYGTTYTNKSKRTRKANEVWTLLELEPGDLVVANHGTSKVLAVGTVIEPGYDWRPDRVEYYNVVTVKWDTSYARDIPPQKAWAMTTVAPVSQSLAADILSKNKEIAVPIKSIAVKPIFNEIANALERKGQVLLYGPPGTGKTYTARHFAIWWLQKKLNNDSPSLLLDGAAFTQAEQKLSTSQVVRRVWWVVANPKEWSWERLFKEKRTSYRYGKLQRNYAHVRKGDLVVGYQSSPDKRIVALATVSRELHTGKDGELQIELEPLARVSEGPTYEELQKNDVLRESEPMRSRCQGTLFALNDDEFDQLFEMLSESEPDLRKYLEAGSGIGPLTQLTFHASYSYEDFIEGFRPVESKGGNLALRLENGIFKRICREAQANPSKPYLVLIDEINRANVAKVFGELITLLERDKRGMLISLPQSKEAFTIPPNVYVLGTMNTADRSIKLLDTALRRRFAFLELMPDSSLLRGGKVGNLALDDFLDELNGRIAAKEGREKQIGHSFLLEGEEPISSPEEFARRFRQEILPLLQEYCYEDFRILADYIGDALVDKEAQMLDDERLDDPDRLIEALVEAFSGLGSGT